MTAGSSTTEHKRAIRAEIASGLLGGAGCGLAANGEHWLLAGLLLALAMACFSAMAIFYSRHRSALKQAEAESAAAQRVAELSMPKQRVI